MNVLIVGANGFTGRLTIPLLKEAGHTPHAMIRYSAQRDELEALGAETVFGDLEKPLGDVVRDNRAVIFAAGSGSKTGPEKTIDIDQNGAIALADTCARFNVRRFIMLSSMCAGELDRVPEKLHHYMAAKGIADDYLRAGDLDFTIVKPGYLTHDPGCGKIKLAQNLGSLDQGKISREDVARAMVECLALDNTIGKGFEILAGETPIRKALEAV